MVDDFVEQYRYFKSRTKQLVKPLTREEEVALIKKIKKARARVYFDIFGYAPFVEGIVKFIQETAKDEAQYRGKTRELKVDFGPLLETTQERRKWSGRFKVRQKWAEQRTLAAIKMAEFDRNNAIAILVNNKMIKKRHPLMKMTWPPIGSQVFETYEKKVDNSLLALSSYKNRFMKANIFLVLKIAKRYTYGPVSFADLVQEGMIGLMKGIERFDETKGFKFSTYGTWWIRHSISRFVDNCGRSVRIPCHMVKSWELMRRVKGKLEAKGIEPTAEILAVEMNITLERVKKIMNLRTNTDSLDIGWDKQEEDRIMPARLNLIDDGPNADDLVEIEKRTVMAQELLEELSPKMKMIIGDRFGFNSEDNEEKTLREVGAKFEVSRERARQLQNVALEELREIAREKYAISI